MRKTKYRGWDAKANKWQIGDFASDNREYDRTCNQTYILPFWEKLNNPIRVVPESVGEWIGKKDIEGRDIFEGDITKDSNGDRYLVYYDEDFACFMFKNVNLVLTTESFSDLMDREADDLVIIGTAYENSELLIF